MPKKNTRLTIEDAHKLAAQRDGKCLSKVYKNNRTKLIWQCSKGHVWHAAIDNMKQHGRWCPDCGGSKRLDIQEMHDLARLRGGKCLSDTYINNRQKLDWECSEGHQWSAQASHIKNGTWCNQCSPNYPLNLIEMGKLAKKWGGRCLSDKYLNRNDPLKWECAEGHIFFQSATRVKHKNLWCTSCSINDRESICRAIFEKLFATQFPRKKPEWLTYTDGSRLELDGYSHKLKIAFEHQGEQHYRIGHYAKTPGVLEKIKQRDIHKKLICVSKQILLIEIKYDDDLEQLPVAIRSALSEYGRSVENLCAINPYDIAAIYAQNSEFKKIQKIATDRGGKCLSTVYDGSHEKLEFQCSEGHQWSAIPNKIKNEGTWCPHCTPNSLSIKKMRVFATKKGGKCLSDIYINTDTPLNWVCENGHNFQVTYKSVKAAKIWCPLCRTNAK